MTKIADSWKFNTGRGYTAAGQPITINVYDDGGVEFIDHARMIKHRVNVDPDGSREEIQRDVMRCYDSCEYID